MESITTLGKSRAKFSGLETFKTPPGVARVHLVSDEVTALCPVTGQPDFYTVTIEFSPAERCVESKTVKLYLQSYRNAGLFAEAFAAKIARDFRAALNVPVQVTVVQKPRGGVALTAFAHLN